MTTIENTNNDYKNLVVIANLTPNLMRAIHPTEMKINFHLSSDSRIQKFIETVRKFNLRYKINKVACGAKIEVSGMCYRMADLLNHNGIANYSEINSDYVISHSMYERGKIHNLKMNFIMYCTVTKELKLVNNIPFRYDLNKGGLQRGKGQTSCYLVNKLA